MRFAKIYLKAFGPYTERVIDLDSQAAPFQMVYGHNEAGKSSLLRAVRALLYGIEDRTQDNFLHEYGALRIGGVLVDATGRRVTLMRRKSRKQRLWEWNGVVGIDCEESKPVDEGVIAELLGGIQEAQFARLFGIDREELIVGGQAILEGHGDVGETLFEAGAGLNGLRVLRAELDSQARELFAPQASKPLINSARSQYDELKRQSKEASVRTDEWSRRHEAHEAAKNELASAKNAIADKKTTKERLMRVLGNLPLIARREDCLKGLSSLTGVPDLEEAFAEHRAAAIAALAAAERRHHDAQVKVSEFRDQVQQIAIPSGVIERATPIQALHQGLGAFQQAQLDIPGLEAKIHGLVDSASPKLTSIGFGDDLAAVETLRPKKGDQERLQALINEHADLSGRADQG